MNCAEAEDEVAAVNPDDFAVKKIFSDGVERDAIDGLILGGTELSLILREAVLEGLPVLDTTQIHVDAALEWLLSE